MPRFVIGVDVGGSGSVAVACDETGTQRVGEGEPANLRVVGVSAAGASIARTVERALAGESAAALFVGAAGAGELALAITLRAELETLFPGTRVGISDDTYIALRAGLPVGDGLVLIAGTGAIASASIDERQHRVGGYGHLLGDEGSGFTIGSAAVRLLMRAYDGRVPFDPMLEEVARALHADCAQDVVTNMYAAEHPVRDLAAIAPIVLTSADAGERSAAKIVQAAALELFELLKALMRVASIQQETLPLVFAGGLLRRNTLLTYLLETRISSEFPNLEVCKNVPEPQFGALACARQLLVG